MNTRKGVEDVNLKAVKAQINSNPGDITYRMIPSNRRRHRTLHLQIEITACKHNKSQSQIMEEITQNLRASTYFRNGTICSPSSW